MRHVNEFKLSEFMAQYSVQLPIARQSFPEEYGFPASETQAVVERMRAAFLRGSYNHDGRAIKATCKALGIKHTRTAIESFLSAS